MSHNDDASREHPRFASRRSVLAAGGGALGVAAAVASGTTPAAGATRRAPRPLFRVPVAPGVEVAVSDQIGGRKGTVVFIPGWPLAARSLELTTLFIADHGYRAVGLDLRGFGDSDAPYGPYDYDVWAHDIQKVLETLALRDVTLVGHSMGGAVALHHTARFGDRVSRLVLAEAPVPRFAYGPGSAAQAAGLADLISGYATDRAATVRASLTPHFFATHTDITTDPFLQAFERQCIDQASLPASRGALIALRDTDLTADLARISVPTLVFHAVHDQIVSLDHGQTLAAGIRGARLITFETAGHGVFVDEPEKFNRELLDFIR